jgi:hypothetical protein
MLLKITPTEWAVFSTTDDDVYINWNTIHDLLRSLKSQNIPLYIGQVKFASQGS